MNQSKNLHKREDGSLYLLNEQTFQTMLFKVNSIVESYDKVADILARYEDTRERAKNPEYIKGVLLDGMDYIKEQRADEVRQWLKGSPLSSAAVENNVKQTIEAIPDEIAIEISETNRAREVLKIGLIKQVTLNDLVIEPGEERCTVSLRDGFEDEIRKAMTTEITEEIAKDIEDFRAAMQTLFRLSDKGYNLKQKGGVGYDGKYQVYPSHVEVMLGKAPEERKELLTTENIIKILK